METQCKTNLEQKVSAYLNSNLSKEALAKELSRIPAGNARDVFEIRTVKRLMQAFDSKYRSYGDFLMALRNYLLVFQTEIHLREPLNPQNAELYGIYFDHDSQNYFCSLQLPDYVNSEFVNQVFLRNLKENRHRKEYNLMTDAKIFELTGFSSFKSEAQKLATYGALNTQDGYTTLISLPTGGGKSLITQTMAYQREGLTIVVVPTVSLAIDQVRSAYQKLRRENVEKEVFYYSSGEDAAPIIQAIQNCTARLFFTSPETLMVNENFRQAIQDANKSRYLKNIIIDEAHIAVDWGASFRMDYQCIETWRRNLLRSNPSIRTILLSATFEESCVSILRRLFSDEERWTQIRCDALRHEPRFLYIPASSDSDKRKKMIELVRKLPHPLIIYVTKPDEADQIKAILQKNGIQNVHTFTGRTTSAKRKKLIDAWSDDQFEIMVATSAFGIGVDKPDVRTVMHFSVPQNPNAYYQELGRGGRDGLPSLSVMCIQPQEDINQTNGIIAKKVLTREKIIGRWVSMYNDPASRRFKDTAEIDTTIRPNYAETEEFDDSPTSDRDVDWNIYVLLLLRRYGLIRIVDIVMDSGKYFIKIQVLNDLLLVTEETNVQLLELIDQLRSRELRGYYGAFELVKNAIHRNQTACWSEMFFETYAEALDYCGGCNQHSTPQIGDLMFPLKKAVKYPLRSCQKADVPWVGDAREMLILCKDRWEQTLDRLIERDFGVIITASREDSLVKEYIRHTGVTRYVHFLGTEEFRELQRKKASYYLSGKIAVLYNGNEEENTLLFKMVNDYLSHQNQLIVAHIAPSAFYMTKYEKSIGDIINGPILDASILIYGG